MTNHSKGTTEAHTPHLEDTAISLRSAYLAQRTIMVVVGGGIAAVEAPRLIRELRRHGASVQVCATEQSLKFVGLESLRWASQNEVTINPSGLSEHICKADAVVVAPATADLISKAAHGICSDGATTFLQSAFGVQVPVIFCQTMHDSLAQSPFVIKSKELLEAQKNVFFVAPKREEGKYKIPDVDILALTICHKINRIKNPKRMPVLITYGATHVNIDPVRCITNLSTGGLGSAVIETFYGMGCCLTVWSGHTVKPLPDYEGIDHQKLPNYLDMLEHAKGINPADFSGLIHLVAASDFMPETIQTQKISSSQPDFDMHFVLVPKLMTTTPLKDIAYKAAAKLTVEHNGATSDLLSEGTPGYEAAFGMLEKNSLQAVLWSTADSAWDPSGRPHQGLFLERTSKGLIKSLLIGKQQIALQYFRAFDKCSGSRK